MSEKKWGLHNISFPEGAMSPAYKSPHLMPPLKSSLLWDFSLGDLTNHVTSLPPTAELVSRVALLAVQLVVGCGRIPLSFNPCPQQHECGLSGSPDTHFEDNGGGMPRGRQDGEVRAGSGCVLIHRPFRSTRGCHSSPARILA